MVINMNDSKLRTIEQIEAFLRGSNLIEFSGYGDDTERYAHIGRVLKRFSDPQRSKRERGVLRAYLERTSGRILESGGGPAGAYFGVAGGHRL
jgi:hypothetical protein